MPGDIDSPLERRAHLLAGRLRQRIDLYRDAVAPKGQRPPFTVQMSKPQALAWWREHFDDKFGKELRAKMKAEDAMELQLALSRANEAEMFGEVPDGI